MLPLPYLEVEAQHLSEVSKILLRLREKLHKSDRQVEQSPSLPVDHFFVFFLSGAGEVVPPVDLHPLASVELQHLLSEDSDSVLVSELEDFLQPYEHHVGGAVDGAGLTVDQVGAGLASPQDGAVLYIVYQQAGVVEHLDDFLDIPDLVLGNTQPQVEASYELVPDVLARNFDNMTVGLQQECLLGWRVCVTEVRLSLLLACLLSIQTIVFSHHYKF